LADYREHYPEIRSAGACLAAVSVDLRESSEALRTQLSLPFPILCDTERRVVKDWDIYNSGERGGIAKPAVFVIDPDQVVRYSSVDSVATRVPAVEIVHLLQPDLCTEFGLEGDCLLNFGHPRFCRIGFMTSTESLPL
jgi:peroxiredoxin